MTAGAGPGPPGPEFMAISRLIIATRSVKDHRLARLGRPGAANSQEQTAIPTQKVIRFQTPLGPVAMMANRKWLLDIGRAMLQSAQDMPDSEKLS